ncbi:MAG: CHAT domain-containing protein [Spirulina sp. SIO3F2]|nr:CHAT domain-containing protein [Spirulina sp. SIO3F2]
MIVQSRTGTTKPLSFQNPIASQDLQDIRWYLETYSASYTTDVDDQRAERIEKKLPEWGTALFTATLGQFPAQAAFGQFYAQKQPGRVFTIGASHPDILALPWELLHIPDGNFLFHSNPRISIRRQFNVTGGFNLVEFEPKAAVRILFVVSRPKDAGFIDPRSDAQAVLDALAKEGEGKVAVEFLRPATLSALVDRLEDDRQPPIDIIHFDGHGVYDPDGRLFQEARASDGLSLTRSTPAEAANMGYLLFEDDKGGRALISAEKLASMLNEQNVGLIVLSACQSAMVGTAENKAEDKENTTDETPESGVMGSVAARLTHSGIPAVLAMTHSVLVATTRELFGQFYRGLARGQGMGEALDNARRQLYLHPERGTRVRGQHQEITLRLQDWFLPALYQAGADTPLLTKATPTMPEPATQWGNLPELQEAGFWGRSRELWLIERAFAHKTRRLTISGFGGQGKTYLALEAGRWLHRTGMFGRVCLVDYSQYQGQDPVSYAVSVLSTVLEQSFVDAAAVIQALSTAAPVLLILDNLEALETEPQRALLDAAKVWSETGATRVLLTTRQPDFKHPDYPIEGSLHHQRLQLQGLGTEQYPDDALAYFQALMQLPPEPRVPQPQRGPLVKLFSLVDFHPLSIGLLARQLKERRIAEVGQRLAKLLLEGAEQNPLVASLMLSLDRVDDGVRRWLPRLGVFEGGAMEASVLRILNIAETDWLPIRTQLETTGLIQAEHFSGFSTPYLKFHPTLAPALWPQCTTEDKNILHAHHQWYYQFCCFLCVEGRKKTQVVNAITRLELPNLMQAVNQAIAANDSNAVAFVTSFKKILHSFGLSQDAAALTDKLTRLQEDEVGSYNWFLARINQGEALQADRRVAEALVVFTEVLIPLAIIDAKR